MQMRSKALPVTVEQFTSNHIPDGVTVANGVASLATARGALPVKLGEYIVTDATGRKLPYDPKPFALLFDRAPGANGQPDTFTSKVMAVTVGQHLVTTRSGVISTEGITTDSRGVSTLITPRGETFPEPNDYVVSDMHGGRFLCTPEQLAALYEPMTARWATGSPA